MDHLERAGHARLAHGAEPVDIGAADPAALRAHGNGLQHVLARAHAAVEMDLDLVTHRVHDRRQRADRAQRAVELPPAVVRHHDGIGADVAGLQSVARVDDALDDQRAVPHLAELADAVPVERLIEALRGPCGQRGGIRDALGMADDIAEEPPLGLQHLEAPRHLGHHVGDRCRRQLGRGRKAVLQILVTLSEHLQIDRDHRRRALGVLGPVEEPLHVVVVLERVDLHPERLRGVLGHILDRADRHGRQAIGHAEPLGRLCRLDLTVGVLHPGHAHRRERHRHRHVLADHLRRGAAPGHVDGDALAQVELVEVRAVLAEGLLGPAARLAVVVEHLRHPALVEAL